MTEQFCQKSVLLIEPFFGGSHKILMEILHNELSKVSGVSCDLVTMTPKKWHWRARASALWLSENIELKKYNFIFASSVLNLSELVALRPDLASATKILYFHENQLTYPVQKQKDRDFQYGYNQILSSLAADKVLFNSKYNVEEFLSKIDGFLKLMPDYRPKNLPHKIRKKCSVLYFPMMYPEISIDGETKTDIQDDVLHIVWPHRWEHDKNPEKFFRVIFELESMGLDYRLSVLGETYKDVPDIFRHAKESMIPEAKILKWGWLESKTEYFKILQKAHVVVSTADHEFFGVAILEATFCGCYPLCPNNLVYPEIFPGECLYATEKQLAKRLRNFCTKPSEARKVRARLELDLDRYAWKSVKGEYLSLFS